MSRLSTPGGNWTWESMQSTYSPERPEKAHRARWCPSPSAAEISEPGALRFQSLQIDCAKPVRIVVEDHNLDPVEDFGMIEQDRRGGK